LSDIILRVLDFAKEKGLDMDAEIERKLLINFGSGTRGRLK